MAFGISKGLLCVVKVSVWLSKYSGILLGGSLVSLKVRIFVPIPRRDPTVTVPSLFKGACSPLVLA